MAAPAEVDGVPSTSVPKLHPAARMIVVMAIALVVLVSLLFGVAVARNPLHARRMAGVVGGRPNR